jgi:hypothetical protein
VGHVVEWLLTRLAHVKLMYVVPVAFYQRRSCAPPLRGAEDEAAESLSEITRTSLSMSAATLGRGILADCHPALYIGRSGIHGRGVFTREPLAKGTRILTIPQMNFMDGVQYLLCLADTHQRIPGTLHYTLPTGRIRELVLRVDAHHLMNHGCSPNVCTGLSRRWWWLDNTAAVEASTELATQATMVQVLEERMRSFDHFDDPNSFFVSRDVKEGEELTLDYHGRFGYSTLPLSSLPVSTTRGDDDTVSSRGERQQPKHFGRRGFLKWIPWSLVDRCSDGDVATPCNCGAATCRGFIFPDPELRVRPQPTPRAVFEHSTASVCVRGDQPRSSSYQIDVDEITMVCLLDQPGSVARYLSDSLRMRRDGCAMHDVDEAHPQPQWTATTMQKRALVKEYRHVFEHLNALEP